MNLGRRQKDEPARKVAQTRARRTIYRFPSLKNECTVAVEEWIEMRICYALEFDRDVASFAAQPETFKLRVDGKPRRYTPDFRVEYRSESRRPLFVEAKPKRLLDSERVRFIESVFAPFIREECGADFDVWTEEKFSRPLIRNLKFLYGYSYFPLQSEISARILGELAKEEAPIPIAALLQRVGDSATAIQGVYHLMFRGLIAWDSEAPVRFSTLVGLPPPSAGGAA